MNYAFQLLPHPNIRYQAALQKLAEAELISLLHACNIDTQVKMQTLGGVDFLCFDAPEISPSQMAVLSRHSALTFFAQKEGDLLRPLVKPQRCRFERDLSEVPKYKGKTSPTFTRMMLHLALCESGKMTLPQPTVLDPMCGRGTTLFVALEEGMNAIGTDLDARDLREADDYLKRYLQYHRMKYNRVQRGQTVQGKNIPEVAYTIPGDPPVQMQLMQTDSQQVSALLRKKPVDILVADLPYGIQHAPQDGRKAESFLGLMNRVLPAWYQALQKGGGMALSFNALTLDKKALMQAAVRAGFSLPDAPHLADLSHFVEQAVTRDVIVCIK